MSAALAKLDTMIRGSGIDSNSQHMRAHCGTGGYFVMSDGVTSIIRGITAQYRPRMEAAKWLAVCCDFVDFLFSKHQPKGPDYSCPMAGVFEPERQREGPEAAEAEGGGETGAVHVVSTCPKCAVVVHVTQAVQEALLSEVRRCGLG